MTLIPSETGVRFDSYAGESDEMGWKIKYTWRMKIENKDRFVIEMLMPGPDGK